MGTRIVEAEAAIDKNARPVWLATLRLPDGRAVRVSSRPIEVECDWAGDDGPYQFDPFLTGMDEFEEELDVFSLDGVGALTQARIEIVAPGTDFGTLQGDWWHVTAATVELALLWEGQAWEDRLVVLDGGSVAGAEFGMAGQGTSIAIESTPPPTSASVGDDSRDLGADYPAPLLDIGGVDEMTDLAGTKYPHVFGKAKSIPAHKIGAVAGENWLILAGHHFALSGASYPVTVYENLDDAGPASVGTFEVTNGTNASGDFAYVKSNAHFAKSNGAYTYDADHGGIGAGDDAAQPALSAEGLIRRLLTDSELPVDWRQADGALTKLRDWDMAFWCDQEDSAINILRDRLTAHLPLVEMNSGTGVWFAYCDPHQAPIEAPLIYGQHLIGRIGRMEVSDLETVRNSFTVNYDSIDGATTKSLKVDASNSSICYFSQQLYGIRVDEPIDCDATADAATAGRIALGRADRLALPRRILTYELAPEVYWLKAGAVVELTDPGYSINEHRAVVTRINRSMIPFTATVHLIDRTPFARGDL